MGDIISVIVGFNLSKRLENGTRVTVHLSPSGIVTGGRMSIAKIINMLIKCILYYQLHNDCSILLLQISSKRTGSPLIKKVNCTTNKIMFNRLFFN